MPTLQAIIAARGAKRGAQEFKRAADDIKRNAEQVTKKNEKTTGSFDRMRKGIRLLNGVIGGLIGVAGLRLLINTFTEFDAALSRIVGLVGVARDQVNTWRRSLLDLAPAVGKAPGELAEALFFITSAGIRGTQAIDALKASAQAAAAGLGETKAVADAVTSAMNAFAKQGLEAADATGILVAAVREGKAEASSLAPALGRVLPVAAELGVEFNEVAAALAAMTRIGLNAEEATTALRSVLATILNPTSEARNELERLGLPIERLRSILRDQGLLAALTELRNRVGDNQDVLATIVPNVRALTGVLSLVGENAESTRKVFEALAVAGRQDLKVAFEEAASTAEFKLNASLAELKTVLVDLGSVVVPIVVGALQLIVAPIDAIRDAIVALRSAFPGRNAPEESAAAVIAKEQRVDLRAALGARTGRQIIDIMRPGLLPENLGEITAQQSREIRQEIANIIETINQELAKQKESRTFGPSPFISVLKGFIAQLETLKDEVRIRSEITEVTNRQTEALRRLTEIQEKPQRIAEAAIIAKPEVPDPGPIRVLELAISALKEQATAVGETFKLLPLSPVEQVQALQAARELVAGMTQDQREFNAVLLDTGTSSDELAGGLAKLVAEGAQYKKSVSEAEKATSDLAKKAIEPFLSTIEDGAGKIRQFSTEVEKSERAVERDVDVLRESNEVLAAEAAGRDDLVTQLRRDGELREIEIRLTRELGTVRAQELLPTFRKELEERDKLKDTIAEQTRLEAEAKAAADRTAQETARPFINAAEGIQSGFSNAFFEIFRGSKNRDIVGSFIDFVRDAFARLLTELATLALVRPIIVPIALGAAGALGLGTAAQAQLAGSLGGGGGGVGALNFLSLKSLFTGLQSETLGRLGAGIAADIFSGGNLLSGAAGIGFNAFANLPAAGIGGLLANLVGLGGGGIAGAGTSLAGGLIGGAVAGPLGAGIGGFFGSVLGGLFGSKPNPIGAIGGAIQGGRLVGVNPITVDRGGRERLDQVKNLIEDANTALTQFLSSAGLAISSTVQTGQLAFLRSSRKGGIRVGGFGETGIGRGFGEDAKGAVDLFLRTIIFELNRQSPTAIEGLSESMRKILAVPIQNLDQLLADLTVAKNFDDLKNSLKEVQEPVNQAVQALELFESRIDDVAQRAIELNLTTAGEIDKLKEAVRASIAGGFNDDIRRRILSFTDPLALTLEDIAIKFKALRLAANELGANVGPVFQLLNLETERALTQAVTSGQIDVTSAQQEAFRAVVREFGFTEAFTPGAATAFVQGLPTEVLPAFKERQSQLERVIQDAARAMGEFASATVEAIDPIEAAINAARSALNSLAIDPLKNAAETLRATLAEQLGGAFQSLARFLQSLQTSELSPLSPRDQLEIARQQFADTLTAARGGDARAIQDLAGLAQERLRLEREVFATGPQFAEAFREVNQQLGSVFAEFGIRQEDALRDQTVAVTGRLDTIASLLRRIEAVLEERKAA